MTTVSWIVFYRNVRAFPENSWSTETEAGIVICSFFKTLTAEMKKRVKSKEYMNIK